MKDTSKLEKEAKKYGFKVIEECSSYKTLKLEYDRYIIVFGIYENYLNEISIHIGVNRIFKFEIDTDMEGYLNILEKFAGIKLEKKQISNDVKDLWKYSRLYSNCFTNPCKEGYYLNLKGTINKKFLDYELGQVKEVDIWTFPEEFHVNKVKEYLKLYKLILLHNSHNESCGSYLYPYVNNFLEGNPIRYIENSTLSRGPLYFNSEESFNNFMEFPENVKLLKNYLGN